MVKKKQAPLESKKLHFKTLTEVAKLIQNREVSSVELTQSILSRIESLDGILCSYATVTADHALNAAKKADKEIVAGRYQGPLQGIPIAVKDLCFTKGVRTMGGTATTANFVPTYDATVVAKLEAAGAVLLGKLNLTEGAMPGYSASFGVPVNPWNKAMSPGGSSSGSAVATASGLAYATLGTDTGGSIRIPAAACGVVGLKPTWGRVSRYGVLALAQSLDHVGPMARSTADVAAMLQVIAGHDPHDPTSLFRSLPEILGNIDAGVKGVRIGVDDTYIRKDTDPEVAAAVISAIQLLESLGAQIVEVQLPDMSEFLPAWLTICSAEAVIAHEKTYPSARDQYGAWFRDWLDSGAKVTATDYIKANNLRAACGGQLREVFDKIDLLACPSWFRATQRVTPEELYGPRQVFDPFVLRFTAPFNLNGAPTLSLPCGLSSEGWPLSLQLVGHHFSEQLLCQAGYAYEKHSKWHKLRPKTLF